MTDMNKDVEVVTRKLMGIVDEANTVNLQAKGVLTVQSDIAKINKTLWDSITKKELVDMLVQNDLLTLDGLVADVRVESALNATKAVLDEAMDEQIANIKETLNHVELVNVLTDRILDEVYIYGITDKVRDMITEFEATV